MNRETRTEKARQTLHILQTGVYEYGPAVINIKSDLNDCIRSSRLFEPEELHLLAMQFTPLPWKEFPKAKIELRNASVLEGATYLLSENSNRRIGCLNFASAKNPGGGFLNGAIAQEESLALSSGLYATQMAHPALYDYNRSNKSTCTPTR